MVKKSQMYSFVTLTKYLGVEWLVGCMFNFQETITVFAKKCAILLSHQQYMRIQHLCYHFIEAIFKF